MFSVWVNGADGFVYYTHWSARDASSDFSVCRLSLNEDLITWTSARSHFMNISLLILIICHHITYTQKCIHRNLPKYKFGFTWIHCARNTLLWFSTTTAKIIKTIFLRNNHTHFQQLKDKLNKSFMLSFDNLKNLNTQYNFRGGVSKGYFKNAF